MPKVVKALLALGVDLMGRDTHGHLAVCWAVIKFHVEVLDVLLEAHAKQGGKRGLEKVLECPCSQNQEEEGYPLLLHAMLYHSYPTTDEADLAMVRCLVQKWGVNARSLITTHGSESYPIFDAAAGTLESVVAFFLDECGMDVNMTTPRTKETVLHSSMNGRVRNKRNKTVRMLKYLVEERGADVNLKNANGEDAWDLAVKHRTGSYIHCLTCVRTGTPTRVADVAPSDEWGSEEEEEKEFIVAIMAANKQANEAQVLLEEQEAKAKEATAALVAELDAEDRQAAAAAAKKKSKKKGNNKK